MKISQRISKPEMWGCFVKKLEAFSVLAADTDARIEVGGRQKNALIPSARQYL